MSAVPGVPKPGPARRSTPQRRLERASKRQLTRWLARVSRPRPVSPADIAALPVRRLLVVRQHNQMGDMVLALPALHALRRNFAEAHLVFLTGPLGEELLQDSPDVDELIVFRKDAMRRPWNLLAFLRHIRHPRADLAVVMGSVSFSTTSALLAWASGARVRAGVSSHPFGNELTRAIYHLELPAGGEDLPEAQRNLVPIRALGVAVDDLPEFPGLRARPEAIGAARQRLGLSVQARTPGPPLVVLHCGAGKQPNIWPAERFAQLGTLLQDVFGADVVLTEGPNDGDVVAGVVAGMPRAPQRWREPLRQTMGLLAIADVVVSNDTGIAHVAAALGTRTIVLYGPTDARRWRPIGPNVRSVVAAGGCIENVTWQEVWACVHANLEQRGFPAPPAPKPR